MKKLYIDNMYHGDGPIGVFVKDTQVIYTGTEVNSAPVSMRGERIVYDAARWGVYFFFDDDVVSLKLYTVPYTESFAWDRNGGFFVKEMDDEAPIYYIDPHRHIRQAAENLSAFLGNLPVWKENMVPDQRIVAFSSREEAERSYRIFDLEELIGKER